MTITPLHPFNGLDIAELVRIRARTRRDHPFLIWEPFEGPGETLTYGAFHHRVARLSAGRIHPSRVQRGDSVTTR